MKRAIEYAKCICLLAAYAALTIAGVVGVVIIWLFMAVLAIAPYIAAVLIGIWTYKHIF